MDRLATGGNRGQQRRPVRRKWGDYLEWLPSRRLESGELRMMAGIIFQLSGLQEIEKGDC